MNLKRLRIQQKSTQSEIAKACDISHIAYHKYENNLRTPPMETLIKLADYFNVSLDYLCDRQYNNQIGYIPDDKKRAVRLILQLESQRQLDKAEAYLSALLDANEEIKQETY